MGIDKNVLMIMTAMGREVSVCKTQIWEKEEFHKV